MSTFLGITRETVFSPGKVEADRAILHAVAERLRGRGHQVRVVSAEDPLPTPRTTTTVFTMAQGERALATLRAWEDDGIRVVNSVSAVLGCHRHRMLGHFRRCGVATPETVLIDTRTSELPLPAWLETDGGWLKRGDVHATEAGDVVFVDERSAAVEGLASFRARGIARAVLQRHVAGVVIKFYAVANGFLSWHPATAGVTRDVVVHAEDELRRLSESGARALGLEVYGGDCVVGVPGGLQFIDLNDWPSYASCLAAAAEAIAAHVEALSEPRDT